MSLEHYAVVADKHHMMYEFLSEGPNGTIKKAVSYQRVDENVFNLAFGDWDELEQKINDNVRSNNNDRDKVLATVASTVVEFMQHHPNAIIAAKGSTAGKTRLYQMGLNKHWKEISKLYTVMGYYQDNWEPFEPCKNYQAFFLKAK